MVERLGTDMAGRSHSWGDERLSLLSAVGTALTDREVMRHALDQAVSELGGLAGLVHWSCGPAGSRTLRLVLASGLPLPALTGWEEIREDEAPNAPARAVRDARFVWLPAASDASPGPGETGRTSSGSLPPGTTVAAVPLSGPGGPVGALSVLTGPREPTPEQTGFLEAVGRWAERRLSRSTAIGGCDEHPWWQQRPGGSVVQQSLEAVKAGSWEWGIRGGEMRWDRAGLALLGIPRGYERRIESWINLIHPEDMPRVMAATEKSLRERSCYEAEYRVRRPDGTTGWVQSRAHLELDEGGEPVRMIGKIWDTTESRMARESVGQALRYMSDAFFAVNRDWRITFLNVEAERLIGAAGEVLGRPLWEGPAGMVPELEDRCRRAAADGRPTGFDIRWPTDDRWYHIRLVSVPDGLTAYLTDVTERRTQAARRAAAERIGTEQTARISELSNALADAVTTKDVVRVVAAHVLPPFGASGLLILWLEGGRLNVVGSVGYSRAFISMVDGVPAFGGYRLLNEVLGSRRPCFISSTEEYQRLFPDLAGNPAIARKNAWAVLPLIASGNAIGTCTVSFDEPHDLSADERTLLTALSGMVAQALARARLYDTEHARAQALQRGLLPRALPSLAALTPAVRYLPASSGTDIGGDWYDVIPLSAERVALVIDDVMGHGLAEAATMGRLRTAVHTLANLELPPRGGSGPSERGRLRSGRRLLRHLSVRAVRPRHGALLARPRRSSAAADRGPRRWRGVPGPDARSAAGRRRAPVLHRGSPAARRQSAGAVHRRSGGVRGTRHRHRHRRVHPGAHQRLRPASHLPSAAFAHRRPGDGRPAGGGPRPARPALRPPGRGHAARPAADRRRHRPADRPAPRAGVREHRRVAAAGGPGGRRTRPYPGP
ncbi:PAS fold-containing protein [Streptomyces sp. MnatMP-M27]|nr:PAS fold-containing protein [Streptomyces sp. MnatMP-M27]